MIALPPHIRVFLYRRPTDMRKSFHGLVALTESALQKDPLLVEALEIRRAANGPNHPLVGLLLVSLGELNTRWKHYDEAERQLLEARAILEAKMAPDHPDPRRARQALAALYDAWGKPDRAAAIRE